MCGIRIIARIRSGTSFAIVSTFSVLPERPIPLIFMRRCANYNHFQSQGKVAQSKNEKYCSIPATIVAIPQTDNIKYKITRNVEILLPNTIENIEQKASVKGYFEEDFAGEYISQDSEIATASQANSELGQLFQPRFQKLRICRSQRSHLTLGSAVQTGKGISYTPLSSFIHLFECTATDCMIKMNLRCENQVRNKLVVMIIQNMMQILHCSIRICSRLKRRRVQGKRLTTEHFPHEGNGRDRLNGAQAFSTCYSL